MATSSFNIGDLNSDIAALNNNLGSPSSASSVTGADAFSKINTLNSKLGLQSGVNSIGGVICAGYNTGSGNYVDFFIPINTNGKTITSVTATNDTSIFLPNARIDFSNAPTITIAGTLDNGVRCEIQYATPQTPSVCVTLYLTAVKITCS